MVLLGGQNLAEYSKSKSDEFIGTTQVFDLFRPLHLA